ncbi:MAG: Rpp14/Pop5 family protein [Nanoarchaeota archaeon]
MGIKGLKPSLREKKRYIAFEIISKQKISSLAKIQKAIIFSMISYKGETGLAQSGLMLIHERFNLNTQRGLIRVNHKTLNHTIAALTLTKTIDNTDVALHTLGVSGIIQKATKFIAS